MFVRSRGPLFRLLLTSPLAALPAWATWVSLPSVTVASCKRVRPASRTRLRARVSTSKSSYLPGLPGQRQATTSIDPGGQTCWPRLILCLTSSFCAYPSASKVTGQLSRLAVEWTNPFRVGLVSTALTGSHCMFLTLRLKNSIRQHLRMNARPLLPPKHCHSLRGTRECFETSPHLAYRNLPSMHDGPARPCSLSGIRTCKSGGTARHRLVDEENKSCFETQINKSNARVTVWPSVSRCRVRRRALPGVRD